jgi:hypothetical protein
MKFSCLLIVLLCTSGVTYCQMRNATPEQVVGRVIETRAYDGISDKQIGRLGDAAATAVTKLLGDKFLRERVLTANEISNVLTIVHMAFAAPGLILNPSDRQPRTTVFVLQCLLLLTSDPALRDSIADTRQFVVSQFNQTKTN